MLGLYGENWQLTFEEVKKRGTFNALALAIDTPLLHTIEPTQKKALYAVCCVGNSCGAAG